MAIMMSAAAPTAPMMEALLTLLVISPLPSIAAFYVTTATRHSPHHSPLDRRILAAPPRRRNVAPLSSHSEGSVGTTTPTDGPSDDASRPVSTLMIANDDGRDRSRRYYGESPNDPLEKLAVAVHDWVLESDLFKKDHDGEKGTEGDAETTKTCYTSNTIFDHKHSTPETLAAQAKTLTRVALPSTVYAVLGYVVYPPLATFLGELPNYDDGVLAVLSQDASQYVQNILVTCALVFGMLVGQTYYFMYQQQENVFYALFEEVTEAKSLLEQVALVCSGRSMYPQLLQCIRDYVEFDLRRLSSIDPAGASTDTGPGYTRPEDDPLESILYLTSVGLPGAVYDTVKSLRRARANRLGALQRKLPEVHMTLLWALGLAVLSSFPVCGSGSRALAPEILGVQAYMFGIMVFGISLVLSVVTELWKPRGGAYNVDGVLAVMVRGLNEELRARMSGDFDGDLAESGHALAASASFPSPPPPILLYREEGAGEAGSSGGGEGGSIVGSKVGGESLSRRRRFSNWIRRRVYRR